jgi:hypothetical protein
MNETVGDGLSTYTVSYHLKDDGSQWACIAPYSGSSVRAGTIYDLQAGTVTSEQAAGGATHIASGIESLDNGWYRCWMTYTLGVASNHDIYVQGSPSGAATIGSFGSISYTPGADGLDFFAWGYQLERSDTLGPYVKTTTAAVSTLKTPTLSFNLTAAGTPTMSAITAAGSAGLLLDASGTPTMSAITAAGTASLAGLTTAAGAASADVITSSGTAVQIYKPSGAATLATITAAGTATKVSVKSASGTPTTSTITASGTASALVAGAIIPPAGRLDLVTFTGLQLFGHPPTAITPVTITPAAGALTLAGYAPVTDRVPEPPAGALVLEGTTPLPVDSANNITIAVAEAPLTLAGYVTSRAYGLLLTGYAPNLVEDSPRPPAGQLTLTGQLPVRIDTSPQDTVVVPPAYAAALDPKNIALAQGQETVDTSLLISGWPPISKVESPIFKPPAGALTLTGIPIVSSTESDPPAGALTLAGKVPTIEISNVKSAAPAAAALVLAGQAPTFFADTQLFQPPVVELTLTEQDAFVGRSIWSAAVARKLNGKIPTVVNTDIGYVVAPAKVSLTLAGKIPVKGQGWFVPDTYAVTLSGKIAGVDLETDNIKVPGKYELAFTSYAPSILNTALRNPAKTSLVLTSYAPEAKTRNIKWRGARTKFIKLTKKYAIEMLYK